MSIDPIAAVSAAPLANPTTAPATTPAADFAASLGQGINQLDASVQAADQQVRALAAGQNVAPQEVMIAMEQTRMQLMFMVEVRNRVVDAYQELMRMQL